MKTLKGILLFLLFVLVWAYCATCFVLTVNAQDITAWDLHPNAVTDNGGYIMFKHMDPTSGDVAFVIYLSFETGINRLVAVHLKQGQNCFTGTRSIKNGQSFVHYNGTPCNGFNKLLEVHDLLVATQPSKPLEERDGSQEP